MILTHLFVFVLREKQTNIALKHIVL